uniref:Integrase_H2C2 domain-containing protein n=1 Tax=Panagrellus redivivus TaxID=6233 RepID=A0A7E4UTD0_PANRE
VFVIAADVEKAFHQIIIAEEDRDYVRILWIRDISKPLTNDNLIALRFARVLFGLKTSPFLLLAVLRKHLTQYYEGSDILKNLYVDNVFIFTDDIEAAIREKPKLKAALADAGMNLRCWFSNNLTIDANFTDDEKYAGEEKRILGIIFDCLKDCFVFNIEIADLGLQWTPARIMKAKLHVFDPLGFLLPVFVSVKLFIHNLVKGRHPLKKPLKPEDERSWRELLNNFKEKQVITVPRYTGQGTDFELHVFCDASSQFVAAAAYLRVKQADGSFRTSLLMAKNHVKDTLIPDADEQKIPKLELVALVVGSQLMQKITIEIDVTFARRYLWSDSQIALAWIKKCPELPFVARRLPEIIKLQCQYGYVQSQLNPADLPTRGCLPNVLQQHHQWWNGPEWLQNEEERWPNPTASMTQLDITEATILLATKNESQSFSSDPSSPSFIPDSSYSPLIDLYRLSTYSKAVSVARKVLQVTSKLLSFANRKLCDYGTKNGRVTWKDACWLLLREEQKRYGQRLIVNSKVVLRDGVFLYVDRYDNARGVQTRLPVLPMESRLAALLALHIHVTMMHAGPPHTLANLRKQAWVIKGRKLVTELIHRCPTCKRHSAIPFHLPDYAQHPSERVNAFDAFKHVGLDYFGPMTLKSNDKRWGLILTCLSTRAIHLELVCDLTVISFVSALTRFTCRRRVPSVIYSDNATTFRATSRLFELHTNTFPNDPTALSFFETNQIDW